LEEGSARASLVAVVAAAELTMELVRPTTPFTLAMLDLTPTTATLLTGCAALVEFRF